MKNKIFFLDNFDSFTYNLVYELQALDYEVLVYRNNLEASFIFEQMKKEEIPPILLISPGPGTPKDAGCIMELIELCIGHFPILGVCLGFQALCLHYKASIVPSIETVHGKTSLIDLEEHEIFKNLPSKIEVARYHSLMAKDVPESLKILASFEDIPMTIIKEEDKILAFQFHPESIMTVNGSQLLKQSLEFLERKN